MPSPPRRLAVTLTFDLLLPESSQVNEYFLSVLSQEAQLSPRKIIFERLAVGMTLKVTQGHRN